VHAPKNPQISNNELHGQQHPQHNINNTFYTPTNDGDASLSRIIPINIWTLELNFDIAPLEHILEQTLRNNIWIGPSMVIVVTLLTSKENPKKTTTICNYILLAKDICY